jgi:excisionase family DNA binding protein
MSTTVEQNITQRYLNYNDAARYSGLSEGSLRALVAKRKLPVYRPTGSRKVLIDRHELDCLIHNSSEQRDE